MSLLRREVIRLGADHPILSHDAGIAIENYADGGRWVMLFNADLRSASFYGTVTHSNPLTHT